MTTGEAFRSSYLTAAPGKPGNHGGTAGRARTATGRDSGTRISPPPHPGSAAPVFFIFVLFSPLFFLFSPDFPQRFLLSRELRKLRGHRRAG